MTEVRVPLAASEFLEKMREAHIAGFKVDRENQCLLMVINGDPTVYASPNVGRMLEDDYTEFMDRLRERFSKVFGTALSLAEHNREWRWGSPN